MNALYKIRFGPGSAQQFWRISRLKVLSEASFTIASPGVFCSEELKFLKNHTYMLTRPINIGMFHKLKRELQEIQKMQCDA